MLEFSHWLFIHDPGIENFDERDPASNVSPFIFNVLENLLVMNSFSFLGFAKFAKLVL